MKHPKGGLIPQSKKISGNDSTTLPAIADVLRARDICRAVVDLKVKDKSYNEIVDFCARVVHVSITKDEIAKVLLEAGKRAKHLNGIYDSLVKPRVKLLAIDEIYQGRRACYLGAADPASHYLFLLRGIKDRTEGTLQETLAALARGFEELRLAITDGLKQYGIVIPTAFADVVHLLCQVHAFRTILREKEEIDRAARKAGTAVRQAKDALAGARKKLYTKRRQLKGKQSRQVKLEQARDTYNAMLGIKRNAKNAPWTPERKKLKANLNQLRAEVRSKAGTIATSEEKIPALQKALKKVEKSYQKKKQASLQAGRLAARFKALLRCRPADFATGKAQLDTILARSKNLLAPKLRKFLKTHPELFATKVPDLDALCPPAAATTNIIEGIFGLLRPLLRKARHFGATPTAAALFEIVRLRHNLTPPYTGFNNGTTPLERAGVHSRYTDYLDALFPPNGIKSGCGWSVKVFEQKIIERIPNSHTGISTGIAPTG